MVTKQSFGVFNLFKLSKTSNQMDPLIHNKYLFPFSPTLIIIWKRSLNGAQNARAWKKNLREWVMNVSIKNM